MLLLIQGLFHSFPALGSRAPRFPLSPSGAKEGVRAETSPRAVRLTPMTLAPWADFCGALRGLYEPLCGPFEHLLSCRAPRATIPFSLEGLLELECTRCSQGKFAKESTMPGTYKITEFVGTSPTSFAEATKAADTEAAKTLRNMDWFQVVEERGKIKDGAVAEFQVTSKISSQNRKITESASSSRDAGRGIHLLVCQKEMGPGGRPSALNSN